MSSNYMKLHSDKTKLLIMGTPTNLKIMSAFNITISDHCIAPAKQLQNIGVSFNFNMNMQGQGSYS